MEIITKGAVILEEYPDRVVFYRECAHCGYVENNVKCNYKITPGTRLVSSFYCTKCNNRNELVVPNNHHGLNSSSKPFSDASDWKSPFPGDKEESNFGAGLALFGLLVVGGMALLKLLSDKVNEDKKE